MRSDQEKPTDDIRDPVFRQMEEQFNQDMAVMTAYQQMVLRRGMVARDHAARAGRERPTAAGAPWPQNVFAAGEWLVQQLLAQAQPKKPKQPAPREADVIIIEGSYRVVEEKKEPPE